VTAVAVLRGPDRCNEPEETDDDAKVENSDYGDEDIIESSHMDYKFTNFFRN
jgi:hypothetical protein